MTSTLPPPTFPHVFSGVIDQSAHSLHATVDSRGRASKSSTPVLSQYLSLGDGPCAREAGVVYVGGGCRMRRRPAWSYCVVGVRERVSWAEQKAFRGLRSMVS